MTRLRALRTALREPGPERDALLLLLKAAAATVIAWQFAVQVLDSPVPFYAPMAALLVVDRTMVRSLSASAQRIAAVVLGLSVAWAVATVVGITWWTMFGVVLVALVIGRWSRLGDHGIQVPAMVLLSLITAKGTNEEFTYLTIVETVAGGVIGVATNAVVLAPLHLTRPRQRVTALARQVHDLLEEMARGLPDEWDHDVARGWYRRGTEVADKAPFVIDDIKTGRESTRFNPRENLRPADIDWEGYEHTVTALRRVLWQVTGIARTLVDAGDAEQQQPAPSTTFLARYAEALSSMAVAVEQFGRHEEAESAAFTQATDRALAVLTELREEVRSTPLEDPDSWPVYGALISESMRAVNDLRASRQSAVVPTDSGPLRPPPPSPRMWKGLRHLGGDRRGQTPTKGSGGALP
nr:FUSC family protein [Terrabacter sp. MAHUQ-38]